MGRSSTISVSLSPEERRAVESCVQSGRFDSAAEVVRESLRHFLGKRSEPGAAASKAAGLAAAYKSSARRDQRLAQEWSALDEAWPEA